MLKKIIFLMALSLNTYLVSVEPYQDVFIKGHTVVQGSNICPERYELIKPILDQFNGEFSVLDIGAAQGYFSFRIAHEYPKAKCVMIEGGCVYTNISDIIHKLLILNDHLSNISLIDKHISLNDLKLMNKTSHFDLILAFLVLHQMPESIDKLMKEVLNLGDNVIIEVSDDVCPHVMQYISHLSSKYKCEYLGDLKRMHHPENLGRGHFFHFKMR